MSLGAWILVGLLAGGLARRVVGTPKQGCLATIAIGVIGGLIGGFLFTAAGGEGLDEFSLYSVFVAFIGASILLLITQGGARR